MCVEPSSAVRSTPPPLLVPPRSNSSAAMDGDATPAAPGTATSGGAVAGTGKPKWQDTALATQIDELTKRREEMKKEKKVLVQGLKNKRKRLRRLKSKAAQLTNEDLFDIVKTRELAGMVASAQTEASTESSSAAPEAPPE